MSVEPGDENPLRDQIHAMKSRVDRLRDRLTQQSLLDREDAVADLHASLEELQTANEELRAQSDEIDAVRHQLELERQRYQDLFEYAPDGYVVTDAHGTIREVNLAASRLFGREPHFLVGKPLATYIGKGDVRAFRAAVNHVRGADRAGGGPEAMVVRVRPRDAEAAGTAAAATEVAITYEPVRDRRGVVGIRWMLRDVTRQRRAERQVQELNEGLEQRVAERTAELESANRTKDRFLAALSHELRTPLTPALAAVGELAARSELPAEVRDELAMVRRNIELETRLIDDLLDLTRVAHEKLALDLGLVDLHDVLRAAADICCNNNAGPRVPNVTLDLGAARHHVRGDAARLTQVFWNLLRNAVKFTPEGGTVTVRTYETGEGPGIVGVDVTDTGIGIDPQVLPRLFGAFEQGDPGVARLYGGLGLGLTISKALVEAHGGRLAAHSDGAGRGSRFTVTLPLATRAARPHDGAAPSWRVTDAAKASLTKARTLWWENPARPGSRGHPVAPEEAPAGVPEPEGPRS